VSAPVAGAVTVPYRVGLLSFSDGRLRVHETLASTIENHVRVLAEAIGKDPLLQVVEVGPIVHSSRLARQVAKRARAADVEAAVFNIPVFAFPNYSLLAARVLELPVLLSSPQQGTLPGLGGVMAAYGAMQQIGLPGSILWGNPLEKPDLWARLSAYCRASGVIQRMRGSVYGWIGGRSIGMNTGVPHVQQWMKDFGVDVEHIDQLEIVRRADNVAPEEVERAYAWLTARLGRVAVEGKAEPRHVKQQVRHYLALRSILDDYGIDFAGIKCHYELSEYFVTACLGVMLLSDPYDFNGPKEPVVVACEADSDAALTMQILKLISGQPAAFFDVRTYDDANRVFVCCNCGAHPSWYAARSDDPAENLARVFLEPVIPKYGGCGGHYTYVCREGEVTLARLSRKDGRYQMFLTRGEFVDFPREKMRETCSAWPHAYVRMDIEPQRLIELVGANHIHAIPGDHRLALRYYCELMGITLQESM
jgi:L-fucose/D-arabinose isomerase